MCRHAITWGRGNRPAGLEKCGHVSIGGFDKVNTIFFFFYILDLISHFSLGKLHDLVCISHCGLFCGCNFLQQIPDIPYSCIYTLMLIVVIFFHSMWSGFSKTTLVYIALHFYVTYQPYVNGALETHSQDQIELLRITHILISDNFIYVNLGNS